MRGLGKLIIGFILGGLFVYGSQRYHVVRADDGLHLVPKLTASFSETYVDVRSFGISDWAEHRTLAAALVKSDKEDLLEGAAIDNFRSGIRTAVESLTNPEQY